MKIKLVCIIVSTILLGCAYSPTVTYQTSPIGASIYELDTGKYLGASPLVVTYSPNSKQYKNGCYIVKGVTAKWASGASSTPYSSYKLCEFKDAYNVSIPYTGDELQTAYDLKIEPLVLNDLMQKKQAIASKQPLGMSDGEAIIIASMISNSVALTNSAKPVHKQTIQPTYSQILPVQTFAGCSSDFSCGSGQVCVKPPLGGYGQCMNSVNGYGVSDYRSPRSSSIGPNLNTAEQCAISSDCPVGFSCDLLLKACVK